MNLQTSATSEYFLKIDRCYRGHRGPGTVLSRADLDCIARWDSLDVPLELVLAGIDLAFSRAGSRIRGIRYCEGFIEEVFGHRRLTRCARPEVPEVSRLAVRAYLEDMARQVDAVSGLDVTALQIRQLDATLSFPDLEQELGRLEAAAFEVIRAATAAEILEQVRRAVGEDVKLVRATMTGSQIDNFERNLWRRKLLERCGVPRLSLFDLM